MSYGAVNSQLKRSPGKFHLATEKTALPYDLTPYETETRPGCWLAHCAYDKPDIWLLSSFPSPVSCQTSSFFFF